MPRDKLDVLDAAAVGDADGRDDLAVLEGPQAQRLGALDAECGLEDAQGHDVVRGEHDALVKVDAEAVRAELLGEDAEL